jgi:hypothetical protein
MFKKTLVFSLAVGLVLMGLCSAASAAQNVANTSQKGSLLIFPKIDVTPGRDTIVRVSNDYFQDVWVKCYWVNRDQEIQDFMFRMTPNQPIWFRASDGLGTGTYAAADAAAGEVAVPPFFAETVGELKCWAVNAQGDQQVGWNWLYGKALVLDYVNQTSYEYNAWAFTARGGSAPGQAIGAPGTLVLSGVPGAYDACPQYLIFDFFAYDPTVGSSRVIDIDGLGLIRMNRTDLTLVPCIQDLRQDRVPTCTKAKFDIWNENETKYTGAYQCLKCWFEGDLNDIGGPIGAPGGFGGEKFTYPGLHTTAGRFRVIGVASTVCAGKYPCTGQVASPLLGVMSTQVEFLFPGQKIELTGSTPFTAGVGAVSNIYWDPGGGYVEAPAR